MKNETEEITLYPVDKSQSSEKITVTRLTTEDLSDISKFSEGEPIVAQKTATVQARPAKVGDVVDTRPRVMLDQTTYTFSETKQTISESHVKKGAVIVTNPDGEEYVIGSQEKFDKKYSPSQDGFVPVDGPKHFVRSNGNYALETSWGETQYVLRGSYFCIEDMQDVYGVTNSAFQATYQTISKKKDNQKNL